MFSGLVTQRSDVAAPELRITGALSTQAGRVQEIKVLGRGCQPIGTHPGYETEPHADVLSGATLSPNAV